MSSTADFLTPMPSPRPRKSKIMLSTEFMKREIDIEEEEMEVGK